MGYYFAYPAVHATQKEGTNAQLVKLNAILRQQAEQAVAIYVDVYDAFGLNATNYLPNNADVHPNMEGYRQMANAFYKHIVVVMPSISLHLNYRNRILYPLRKF